MQEAAGGGNATPVPMAEDVGDAETSLVRSAAGSPQAVTLSTATGPEMLMLDVASANELRSGFADDAVSISPLTPATPTLPSLHPAASKPVIGLGAPLWLAQAPC